MPIPQDDDTIALLVNNNETVQVKRKTLLISPVFRDAFGIQSIGDAKEAPTDQQIKIDASAKGVRWLFGLLEGSTLKALEAGPKQFQGSTTFDPQPIHEARALADRYDIAFFGGILAQAMLTLARSGERPAATALGIAYAMHDQALCEFAVSHLGPHYERPHTLRQEFANAIGHGASGALAMAYLKCESFCPCRHHGWSKGCGAQSAWTGSREQWAELARNMELSKI